MTSRAQRNRREVVRFSCWLELGTPARVKHVLGLFAEAKAWSGGHPGFEAEASDASPTGLRLHDDSEGDVDAVAAFVAGCARALDLSGLWAFTYARTPAGERPGLGGGRGGGWGYGFGGGACVVDLDAGEPEIFDASQWLATRDLAAATVPARPGLADPEDQVMRGGPATLRHHDDRVAAMWITDESGRHILSARQWAILEPMLLSVLSASRMPKIDLRATIEAIILRHRLSIPWARIPAELVRSEAAASVYKRWSDNGLWERLLTLAEARGTIAGCAMPTPEPAVRLRPTREKRSATAANDRDADRVRKLDAVIVALASMEDVRASSGPHDLPAL